MYVYTSTHIHMYTKYIVILQLQKKCIQAELGEMDNWQEDANAWEEESDATWEAEEVLR